MKKVNGNGDNVKRYLDKGYIVREENSHAEYAIKIGKKYMYIASDGEKEDLAGYLNFSDGKGYGTIFIEKASKAKLPISLGKLCDYQVNVLHDGSIVAGCQKITKAGSLKLFKALADKLGYELKN